MINGIKILRVIKNLKQDDLAELTGIAQARISSIEIGYGRPITSKEFVKIQNILGPIISRQEFIDILEGLKCPKKNP